MSVLNSFKKVSGVFYHGRLNNTFPFLNRVRIESFQTKTGKITKVGEIYNVVMQIL